jgi:hypothetical protein
MRARGFCLSLLTFILMVGTVDVISGELGEIYFEAPKGAGYRYQFPEEYTIGAPKKIYRSGDLVLMDSWLNNLSAEAKSPGSSTVKYGDTYRDLVELRGAYYSAKEYFKNAYKKERWVYYNEKHEYDKLVHLYKQTPDPTRRKQLKHELSVRSNFMRFSRSVANDFYNNMLRANEGVRKTERLISLYQDSPATSTLQSVQSKRRSTSTTPSVGATQPSTSVWDVFGRPIQVKPIQERKQTGSGRPVSEGLLGQEVEEEIKPGVSSDGRK